MGVPCHRRPARAVPRTAATSPLMAVPLELEGKLDESKEWEVEVSSFFFVFVVWLSFFFFLSG